ncbi:hypothetical protein ABI_17660 [Asticcacaulis biprosthecium C19]|uniref:Uncharacterized protein n=1 Tax=Asticcacaulis biprosthecium C19 TaxID=715226 RepID=F4QKM4_9CAUL|nr:hypothetical protein [Asticcacaulis biprosthecium]EGF93326.1 hypothetical protein ABI_17660 [Asticcacaulis biprosthecium C19]
MRAFALPLFAVLSLGLVQCSPQSGEEEAKPTDFRSTVEVKLTPATVAKLGEKGEKVVLKAFYFGIVTQETVSLADPNDGTIHLGTDMYDPKVKDGQTVHLTAKAIDRAKLGQISQGKPIVRLETYAAKDGKRVETMLCNDTQDYVEVLQKQVYTIRCDLNQQ